jgi:regulator of protease activity HflC (stomatin/prohibitin superfamily)
MEDRELRLGSGWVGVALEVLLFAAVVALIVVGTNLGTPHVLWAIVPLFLVWIVCMQGFFVVNPNEARVVQLFGTYVGTIRDVGFFFGNPFYWRTRVSLRVRTFETGMTKTEEKKDAAGRLLAAGTQHRQPLKVNDANGTPIDIAAVVVWHVVNPAESVFAVDDYEEFVLLQADAALRNLASRYSYDAPETDVRSLRGHIEEVAAQLRSDLHDRMKQAGVDVQEARISYLAYAPEIASAMLQRQQAGAIIAARAQIVAGAVGMVESALEMLKERNVVDLDGDRRAAMVSNLLVVLCGHTVPQPIINTGTLYN